MQNSPKTTVQKLKVKYEGDVLNIPKYHKFKNFLWQRKEI